MPWPSRDRHDSPTQVSASALLVNVPGSSRGVTGLPSVASKRQVKVVMAAP